MTPSATKLSATLLALLVLCVLAAVPAAAQDSTYIQVVHNSPDPAADTIDVYFADTLAINDLAYIGTQALLGAAPAYDSISTGGAGSIDLDISIAGQESGSTIGEPLDSGESLYDITATLQAGQAYLAVATGVLDPTMFEDNPDMVATDFQVLLLDGQTDSGGTVAMVSDLDTKIIHGTPDAPTIDAAVRGEDSTTDLVESASYTDATPYLDIPIENVTIDVTTADNSTILGTFQAPLSLLGLVLPPEDTAPSLSVYASGFATTSDEPAGALPFRLIAVSSTGTVIPLTPITAPGVNPNALVINEFLADPATGPDGDANGDGTREASEDEFVEVVNTADTTINLGGFTISDSVGVRHTFPDSTLLEPGKAITVFGGGTPQGIPGQVQTASSGLLGLSNSGDAVILRDPNYEGGFFAPPAPGDSLTYGDLGGIDADNNVSVARNPGDPEAMGGVGNYTQSTLIDGDGDTSTGLAFTPGLTNDGTTALPVEFAGQPVPTVDGGDVTLQWTTLQETDNAGFYVQHRRAGQAGWTTANDALIEGAGTTTSASTYRFTMTDLTPGSYRFRVRQVDVDNGATFSPLSVEVNVGTAGFALEGAYPNPFASETTLEFSAPEGEEVEAFLYNSLGQKVRSLSVDGSRITVEAEDLASGLYFVRLQAGDRTSTQSLMLVR